MTSPPFVGSKLGSGASGLRAARLRGFEEDLHLEGEDFNTILSILYVGYIIMQIPSCVPALLLLLIYVPIYLSDSNMLLNYIGRPSLYIPACMVVWGLISVLTGTF